jgi:hypothetical protein
MDFPSDIGFLIAEPNSEAPAYVNESQSLNTIAVSTGAQRWGFTLTTIDLKERDLRRAWAFLNALGGQAKTFNVMLPVFSQPLGAVIGQVQSQSSYSTGTDNISFSNYTPEIGDFFRFAGHSKVYQVSNTAGSSATIFPPLTKPVSLAELITVNDVKFTVRLTSKISKLKIDIKRVEKLKFKVTEAF